MKVEVNKKEKSTLEVNIVVENEKVKKAYDDLFKEVVKGADIKGFRKGQAPDDVVLQNTDVSKLYGEVINVLLQTYYPQALKENHIQPIANPQVEIKEFDIEKDFEFTAIVAVMPEVKIGDYKTKLAEIEKSKSEELKKLNAEKLAKGEKMDTDHIHLSADDVITALLEVTEVEIADVIVEDETNRMMSRLVDQAQSVGLSLDQYLQAQSKTADELRNEYSDLAVRNLKAEFALSKLIEDSDIKVTDEEIDQMFGVAGDPQVEAAKDDPSQRLYVKSILAKNKLISHIIKEVEEPHEHDHEGNKVDTKEEK